jgi:hypothetical protein
MVRYNILKIFINANEAKPGGNIGAMLSPYLYSVNMADFCKRFNEQTKDYNNSIIIPVVLFCDVRDRSYTFYIKVLAISMFISNFFSIRRRLSILNVYDLIVYFSKKYNVNEYRSALMIFAMFRGFKRTVRLFFDFFKVVYDKIFA